MRYLPGNVEGWMGMTLWYLGIKRPFRAKFQEIEFRVDDGQDFLKLFRAVREKYIYTVLRNKFTSFEEGQEHELGFFRFPFNGSSIKLYFWQKMRRERLLAIYSQFLAEQYAMLNVRDRQVLDVGASCGDTAIYFGLKGASEVVALEPFPAVCELAKLAFEATGLKNVLLLNEGAGKPGIVSLDPAIPTDPSTSIEATEGGTPVRLSSLEQLVNRFSLDNAALKIDCEGCEYDLINDASDETLHHFPEIVLEYERPPELYVNRLLKAGYKVEVFRSSTQYVKNSPVPALQVGLVYGRL
jgi:FkbM family methyltransferase